MAAGWMRAGFLRPGRRLKPITTTDSAHFKIHQPENGRFGILKQATSPSVRRLDFRFCNGPSAVNPFFRRIHYRVRFANCSAPRKSGTAAIRLAKEGIGCRERSVAGLQTLPLATICRKGGAFSWGLLPSRPIAWRRAQKRSAISCLALASSDICARAAFKKTRERKPPRRHGKKASSTPPLRPTSHIAPNTDKTLPTGGVAVQRARLSAAFPSHARRFCLPPSRTQP